MKRLEVFLLVLFVAGLTVVTAAAQARQTAPAGGSCDRACLLGIADSYFAAMAAHDPKRAPFAANVKFTENTRVLPMGEGLWKNLLEGPTTFKIYVPDPVAGQIGFIGMLKETPVASTATFSPAVAPAGGAQGGAPRGGGAAPTGAIQLALRLKVQNRQITEAEHIVARIGQNNLANLQTPRPGLIAVVPPAERLSRDLMLLIGNSYYDAIVQSNGNASPFADDCERRENGMRTAGPGGTVTQGCRGQLTSRAMSYIQSIDLRPVWIADEETGLVFGLTMFRHPMEEKFVTLLNPDGTTTQRPMNFNSFDFEAAHIFKIRGGKIHEIEAMGFSLPFHSKNGWSDFLR